MTNPHLHHIGTLTSVVIPLQRKPTFFPLLCEQGSWAVREEGVGGSIYLVRLGGIIELLIIYGAISLYELSG